MPCIKFPIDSQAGMVPPFALPRCLSSPLLEQPEAVPVLRRVVSYLRQEDLSGAAWESQLGVNGSRLTVISTGRDPVLGFASGQLVELSDDSLETDGSSTNVV